MKAFRLVKGLVILSLILALGPIATAQGPTGTWVSGIACQNLSDTEQATIMLAFYPEGSGTAALTYTDPVPIDPGGSRNYYTASSPPGVPDPFIGAVVVSSDQPLACNVNTQTTGVGTQADPYRIGTSAGISADEAATEAYAPQVMKNLSGWSSYVAVQNTETSSVDVTVTYKDRDGNDIPAATETATIPGQSSKVFYQASNTDLPDQFLGAAAVSADDGISRLATVVNFYNSGSDSSSAQLHSYNGFSSGADKLFVPRIVRNYYGYNGGLSIQNIGSAATTVTIAFYFGGSTYTYNSGSIVPGAALPLYAPDVTELDPVDSLPETQRFGSAEIQAASGGTIVAIINEDNRGGPGVPAERVGKGSTYNAFADGLQTDTVFFAQITRKAGGVFSGGFQVANTTSTAGACDIAYAGAALADETGVTLPASGVIARYGPNVANLPDGFNSSASVVCTQSIIGISNLAAEPGSGKYGDSFTQGNGLNR